MTSAAGPLGRRLGSNETELPAARGDSNARIVVNRTAFLDQAGRLADAPVLAWAEKHNLGQSPRLVTEVAARRTHALLKLREQGYSVKRMAVSPQWRLTVGHGDHANAHETGLSLHGTYGWPQIPGSSLKGAADAQARAEGRSVGDRGSVYGWPRPAADQAPGPVEDRKSAGRGSVQFLDALPRAPVTVIRDVLTPHVQPYYSSLTSADPKPPSEHYHPVPVEFLTVSAGEFTVDLVGDEVDVDAASGWLRAAAEDCGLGAKTAAGYGYLIVADQELPE